MSNKLLVLWLLWTSSLNEEDENEVDEMDRERENTRDTSVVESEVKYP